MLKVYADSCFESRFPVSLDGSMSAKKENAISVGGRGMRITVKDGILPIQSRQRGIVFRVFLMY